MKGWVVNLMFKVLVSKIKHSLIRLVNITDAPKKERYPFDKKIWLDILEGIEFGYEPKYYMKSGNIYNLSIEDELSNYLEVNKSELKFLSVTYCHLLEYIDLKIEQYDNLVLFSGEDELGEYFIVKVLPE